MTFQIGINEHDAIAYVKIQIAGKAIHEAALLAYYCEGRRKAQFHEELEREIAGLLEILQIDERATKNAVDEAVETLEYQVQNLRAALHVIEDTPPREIESAWSIATRALRDDDELAACAAKPIR
jgi:enoyl-[acyl-carrier-protein] reductase (NADH)